MVEARVESLEKSMHKVDLEIQMVSKTMKDISDTLREIKDDQKRIQKFETEKVLLERDLAQLKSITDLLFKKYDNIKDDVDDIKEVNAGSAVKINNAERVFWIIITGAIGALGIFSKSVAG